MFAASPFCCLRFDGELMEFDHAMWDNGRNQAVAPPICLAVVVVAPS
jgi:hypothetical protein